MTVLEIQLAMLQGRVIIKAEHLQGYSDADEKVRLILDDGTTLTIGTSEWLHVEIQPEPSLTTF
jgi:hypothetical protein